MGKINDQWRTPQDLFDWLDKGGEYQRMVLKQGFNFDIDTKCSTANKYCVTSTGRIYSKISNKFLKLIKHKSGYLYVNLGRTRRMYVHRLVAICYIPNPGNKPCVNHINGVKDDNRVENLEWCTHYENMMHGWDAGQFNRNIGERNSLSKLTYSQVVEIISKYIPYKYTQQRLAEEYGVSRAVIQQIVEGRSWVR